MFCPNEAYHYKKHGALRRICRARLCPEPNRDHPPRRKSSSRALLKRERERESLTHSNNTTNTDNFSLIYYIYRKIPETDSDGDYWLFTSVHYPFFYPFFARFLFFFQEYSIFIENKNFSEKISLFSSFAPYLSANRPNHDCFRKFLEKYFPIKKHRPFSPVRRCLSCLLYLFFPTLTNAYASR